MKVILLAALCFVLVLSANVNGEPGTAPVARRVKREVETCRLFGDIMDDIKKLAQFLQIKGTDGIDTDLLVERIVTLFKGLSYMKEAQSTVKSQIEGLKEEMGKLGINSWKAGECEEECDEYEDQDDDDDEDEDDIDDDEEPLKAILETLQGILTGFGIDPFRYFSDSVSGDIVTATSDIGTPSVNDEIGVALGTSSSLETANERSQTDDSQEMRVAEVHETSANVSHETSGSDITASIQPDSFSLETQSINANEEASTISNGNLKVVVDEEKISVEASNVIKTESDTLEELSENPLVVDDTTISEEMNVAQAETSSEFPANADECNDELCLTTTDASSTSSSST